MPRYQAQSGDLDSAGQWRPGSFEIAGFDADSLAAAKAEIDRQINAGAGLSTDTGSLIEVWEIRGHARARRELGSSEWTDA